MYTICTFLLVSWIFRIILFSKEPMVSAGLGAQEPNVLIVVAGFLASFLSVPLLLHICVILPDKFADY